MEFFFTILGVAILLVLLGAFFAFVFGIIVVPFLGIGAVIFQHTREKFSEKVRNKR